MLTSDPTLRFNSGLDQIPRLRRHLARATVTSRDLRAPTVVRRARVVVKGNIALVGDASGSVDAITGDGITVALHQAVALARCLARGALHSYETSHRRVMWLPDRMSASMLYIDHHPRLRRRILRTFARRPWIFEQLLALHVRAWPFTRSGPASRRGVTTGSRRTRSWRGCTPFPTVSVVASDAGRAHSPRPGRSS